MTAGPVLRFPTGLAAGLAALAALGCGAAVPSPSDAQASTISAEPLGAPHTAQRGAERGTNADAISAQRRTAITEAVARIAPSVVTVQTEAVQKVVTYDFFFGPQSREQTSAGIGSGFIIRADGVILTNAHVVAGATRISVAMRDGQTYQAKLLGIDENNDLAVLQIPAARLPVATLGTSRDVIVGEWAVAIGNPFGFVLGNVEPSVTAGVISATGRNLTARSDGGGVYLDMIQTDASINPGNSGGPLVNALGEVIGVNSSIYSPNGGSVGLGFAIPIDRARRVAEDLIAHGRARQPWIGVRIEEPSTDPADRQALTRGAVVSQVTPESPAAQAGIRRGDVIVRSRDRVVRNGFDWEAELLDLRVGDEVPLVVRRDGRDVPVRVTVADRPEVTAPRVSVLRDLELVDVTPAIRAERNIQYRNGGALIVSVTPRVSEDLGLATGDVIYRVMNTTIRDARQAKQVLESFSGKGRIRMYFERGGRSYYTDFSIQP
ncbi:MAG: trypsin-like peptidase domain-containing protein [Gemmatimonadota bacterium]|nr:trypsin-like peptidase domain-containing protein [Gemmatimonadota bacterium]